MNTAALPYRSLIELTAMSPDVSADLRVFEALVRHAWIWDTGGLVPYEIARALTHDLSILDRPHAVGLLHHHIDGRSCPCGIRTTPWHWAIHDFHTLTAPRGPHVVATSG